MFSCGKPITSNIPEKNIFSDGLLDVGKSYINVHLPQPYPLNERYEVDLSLHPDKAKAKIYNCGMVELIVT